MSIYRVTYLSDSYKVKGYLGIPDRLQIRPAEILFWLQQSALFSQLGDECGFEVVEEPASDATTSSCMKANLPPSALSHPSEATTVSAESPKLPLFVYCRGGIGRVGAVRLEWIRDFLLFDCIVFAPTYRGSEGSEGRDEFGGRDVEDVLAGIELVRALPFVDENRITVMGFSRGSINATLTAIREPSVHSLVLWGGVSDLAATYEERIDLRRMLKRVVGGSPRRAPEGYRARSPIMHAADIPCPVIIMHGTEDVQVSVTHATRMVQALQDAIHPAAAIHLYEGYGHHVEQEVRIAMLNRMFSTIRSLDTQ